MACPDRSCDGRQAHRTDNAFKSKTSQKAAVDYRAESGNPTALRCKERATAVRDVCFRFCFLFRPGGALKMSVM
jgi:hypothetical protein